MKTKGNQHTQMGCIYDFNTLSNSKTLMCFCGLIYNT